MNAKKEYVLFVVSISNWRRWRLTISLHGVKVERLLPRIARCFAENATEEKVVSNVL